MIPIVPAIIPKSANQVLELLPQLSFASEIQIDVVDGQLVPYTSWPYNPAGEPTEVKVETDKFTLEVDLMVKKPIEAAREWLKAGADMLVFHTESIDAKILANFSETTKASIGIALVNETPLESLELYLEAVDYVQLMGIAKIGAQAQPFDERVLGRISELKKRYPHLTISIDGSVNQSTIKKLVEAGADRLVCGSAIVGQTSFYQAYETLRGLIMEPK